MRRIFAPLIIALFAIPLAGCIPLPTSSTSCAPSIVNVFPPNQWANALAISRRESGLNPRAQNSRSTAAGCFQILSMHRDLFRYGWDTRYDAHENCLAALALWRGSGWRPWRL